MFTWERVRTQLLWVSSFRSVGTGLTGAWSVKTPEASYTYVGAHEAHTKVFIHLVTSPDYLGTLRQERELTGGVAAGKL